MNESKMKFAILHYESYKMIELSKTCRRILKCVTAVKRKWIVVFGAVLPGYGPGRARAEGQKVKVLPPFLPARAPTLDIVIGPWALIS